MNKYDINEKVMAGITVLALAAVIAGGVMLGVVVFIALVVKAVFDGSFR